MKYTLLSKWTVLILTLVTVGLIAGGINLVFGGGNVGVGILLVVLGLPFYAIAWLNEVYVGK